MVLMSYRRCHNMCSSVLATKTWKVFKECRQDWVSNSSGGAI
jgi:hypothetical protein